MAAISTFSALHPISRPANPSLICRPSLSLTTSSLRFAARGSAGSFRHLAPLRLNRVRAAEQDALLPEQEVGGEGEGEGEGETASPSLSEPPAVTVPVSPSDILTMFFQAEGTLTEAAISSVTEALEQTEGITDLKVKVVEGIGSVELTKQTTIQSTGVASGLIETIQGAGFKLQTLNLSFEDKEEAFV